MSTKIKQEFKFNQEHFEAWLFAQPRERNTSYREGDSLNTVGCAMCNYLRDSGYTNFIVGGNQIYFRATEEWIYYPLLQAVLFPSTLGESQDKYEQIYGPVHKSTSQVDLVSMSTRPGNEAPPVNQVELQTTNQK